MRRILVIGLALALSGCASGFGSVTNPVTRNNLVAAEEAYGIALSGAVAYRKLCNDKVIARAQCAPVVAQLQSADGKVQIALKNLRLFQANNPTVDAVSLVTAVQQAVADFQTVSTVNGVK